MAVDTNAVTGGVSAPWPHGEQLFTSKAVDIVANKTGWEWEIWRLPCTIIPVRIQIVSESVTWVAGDVIAITVQDIGPAPGDTSRTLVNAQALTLITGGALARADIINVAPYNVGPFYKDSSLMFTYTSTNTSTTEASRKTVVRIWYRPAR